MTAVTIGQRKLKIILDAKESSIFFCTGNRPTCADPKTRRILAAVLKQALPRTDFELDCDRLFVEIYPSAFGGHIIYFTKAPLLKRFRKNHNATVSFVLKFAYSSDASELCKKINLSDSPPLESSFYKYKGDYCLIISSSPEKLPYPLITEFADSLVCSDTAAATVSEYGNSLICENAIEILAQI